METKLTEEQKELVRDLVALSVGFSRFPKGAEDDPLHASNWHSYDNDICDIEKQLGLNDE